ncbi:MAG TPA: EVE domain-containing protein [Mesotoga infera]|nr:EVE domain-containing protein [Mesotoga infera]HRV02705.1 EVE domain-containing protein [Mesotoga sp.]
MKALLFETPYEKKLNRPQISLELRCIFSREGGAEVSFWIFQGNPTMFRVDDYLRDNFADRKPIAWLSKQFSADMEIGDIVFIWRAKGRKYIPGIVAKGEIVSRPSDIGYLVEDYWVSKTNLKEGLRVRIKLSDVRLSPEEGMLTRNFLEKTVGLEKLSILQFCQSTNFVVTEAQAELIEKLWREAAM